MEKDAGAVQLDHAIEAIRVRFGSQALTRAAELPPPPPWPSGTPLDRLTGIGGLPCGRLTLLTGSGTCGKLTLALSLLASATHEFAHAVVIDSIEGFDPSSLLPFQPDLATLTVFRSSSSDVAGEAASALARAGAGFILLLGEVPEPWLGPLESGASRSGSLVVGVVDASSRPLAHASSLSLGFSRLEWVWDRMQLVGLKTAVRCLKNKVAPPIGELELEIRYVLGAATFTSGSFVSESLSGAVGQECVSAVV